MKGECENKETDLRRLNEERSKLQGVISSLEYDLAALRKEVNHRDNIIHDRVSQEINISIHLSIAINSNLTLK